MTFAEKTHGRRGSSRASWSMWPILIRILSPIVARRRQLTRCVACCKPTDLNSDFLGEITFGWITSCNFKASIEVGNYFHQLTWINNLYYVVCANWNKFLLCKCTRQCLSVVSPAIRRSLSLKFNVCLRNRTRWSNYNNFRTINDNLFSIRALLHADTIAECIQATKKFLSKLVSLFHTIAPIWSRQLGQYSNQIIPWSCN